MIFLPYVDSNVNTERNFKQQYARLLAFLLKMKKATIECHTLKKKRKEKTE